MSDRIIDSWINIYIDKIEEVLLRASQGKDDKDRFIRKFKIAGVLAPLLQHYNAAGMASRAFDLVEELNVFDDKDLKSTFYEVHKTYVLTKFRENLLAHGVDEELSILEDVPYEFRPAALLLFKNMGYSLNERQSKTVFSNLEAEFPGHLLPAGKFIELYLAYNLIDRYLTFLDTIDGSLTLSDLFVLIRAKKHNPNMSQRFLMQAYEMVLSDNRDIIELPTGIVCQHLNLSRIFILSLEIGAEDFGKAIFAELENRYPGVCTEALRMLLKPHQFSDELCANIASAETIKGGHRLSNSTLLEYFQGIHGFRILCLYASGTSLARIAAKSLEREGWRGVFGDILDSLLRADRLDEIEALGISLQNNFLPVKDLNVKPLLFEIAFFLMERELYDFCLRFSEYVNDSGLRLAILSVLHRKALGGGAIATSRKAAELYLDLSASNPPESGRSNLQNIVQMLFLTGRDWQVYYEKLRQAAANEENPQELIWRLIAFTATAALVGNHVDFVDASEQLLRKASDYLLNDDGDDGELAVRFASGLAFNLNHLVGMEKAMSRKQELWRALQG